MSTNHDFCQQYHKNVRHAFEEKYTPQMGACKVSAFQIASTTQNKWFHVTAEGAGLYVRDITACCRWSAKAQIMERLLHSLDEGGPSLTEKERLEKLGLRDEKVKVKDRERKIETIEKVEYVVDELVEETYGSSMIWKEVYRADTLEEATTVYMGWPADANNLRVSKHQQSIVTSEVAMVQRKPASTEITSFSPRIPRVQSV